MVLSPGTIKSRRIKKNVKRLGRGNGSGCGTYSTRGLKGQNARSGNKGTALKSFKQSLQKIPKLRGFNSFRVKPEIITLAILDRVAKDGERITPFLLKKRGLINQPENGVKILATGEIKKKIICQGCLATKQAQVAIEKAGGQLLF